MTDSEGARERDAAPTVAWLELFYDLVVVSSVAVLSESVRPSTSVMGEIWILLAATCLFWIWLMTTLVFGRFPPNDDPTSASDSVWRAIRTVVVFAQMIAVSVVVLAVGQDHEGISNNLGILALGVALLALAGTVGVSTRVYRATAPVVRAVMILFAVVGAVIVAGSFLPERWLPILFIIAFVALTISFIVFVRDHSQTVDFPHLQERMGVLFIIVLGEAILTMTLGVAEHRHIDEPALFWVAVCFPLVAFVMYFKIPAFERGTVPPLIVWVAVSFILIVGLDASGAALALRATDAEVLESAGSGDKVTVRLVIALVAIAALCLIGKRVTRRPALVYVAAVILILIATAISVQLGWAGKTLIILQVLIFTVSVLAAVAIAGREKRRAARRHSTESVEA